MIHKLMNPFGWYNRAEIKLQLYLMYRHDKDSSFDLPIRA